MNPFRRTTDCSENKSLFINDLGCKLASVKGVISVSFVGSFIDKCGLDGISDIDVVVITNKLDECIFTTCKETALKASPALLGLDDYQILINDTFGPLKFDKPKQIVIHLMVYSREAHRSHVLKSPFTCLDWERSKVYFGKSLKEVYPVLRLQPNQIIQARRGIHSYINDLRGGFISFRRYSFSGNSTQEVLDKQPLDSKHEGEFAYHIVKNFITNFSKLLNNHNNRLDEEELVQFWKSHLPKSYRFKQWFIHLSDLKKKRANSYPDDTLSKALDFILEANREIQDIISSETYSHKFARHSKTALNDGSFLGQNRNPTIISKPNALNDPIDRVFTSCTSRAVASARSLAPNCEITQDPCLNEINYGEAEGLTFNELSKKFPEMIEQWNEGKDPHFPRGENTSDVLKRLLSFLSELPRMNTLSVTHNVVLRCLLGHFLGIDQSKWYLIPIKHDQVFDFISINDELYPNLPPHEIEIITDAITEN